MKEYLKENQPSTITDIARLIQVSQTCYHKVSAKDKKQSKWRSNILAKIKNLKKNAQGIKEIRERENLNPTKKSLMSKIFRNLGLPKYKKKDQNVAISLIEEKIDIYQKKLEMYYKRVEFRKTNRSFELYRGNLYRNLQETKETHDVPVEKIRTFWSTMWNKPDNKQETDFSQYLLEYTPKTREENTFISEEEFKEIIRFLPNRKAPGINEIYKFSLNTSRLYTLICTDV